MSTVYPYPTGSSTPPPDPVFRPNANITRGQLAKIISNSANYDEDIREQLFADVASYSTYFVWVNRLARHGVMTGYPCGTTPLEPCDTQDRPYFRWGNNATRGQVARIVSKNFFPNCYVP